jgi:hypothetical protein
MYGDAPAQPGYHYHNGHENPSPVWDHVLEDGDVLYIPRGWQHAAAPVDEPSLHLTVVCHNNTGIDFLRWLQDEMRVNPIVQRELPRFGSPEERAQHMASLRAEILSLLDEKGLERYFLMSDAAAQPHPRFSLPWSVMPAVLPPSDGTMVRFTSPRRITVRSGADPQTIDVLANGERWQFSSQVHDLFHVLLDGKLHSINELCAAGGSLDRERVRGFLGELLLQGLIAVVDSPCLPLELDEAAD